MTAITTTMSIDLGVGPDPVLNDIEFDSFLVTALDMMCGGADPIAGGGGDHLLLAPRSDDDHHHTSAAASAAAGGNNSSSPPMTNPNKAIAAAGDGGTLHQRSSNSSAGSADNVFATPYAWKPLSPTSLQQQQQMQHQTPILEMYDSPLIESPLITQSPFIAQSPYIGTPAGLGMMSPELSSQMSAFMPFAPSPALPIASINPNDIAAAASSFPSTSYTPVLPNGAYMSSPQQSWATNIDTGAAINDAEVAATLSLPILNDTQMSAAAPWATSPFTYTLPMFIPVAGMYVNNPPPANPMGGSPTTTITTGLPPHKTTASTTTDKLSKSAPTTTGKLLSTTMNQSPTHLIQRTPKKRHACKDCDLVFIRNHDLLRHIRSRHTELKPFGCDRCGRMFARADSLRKHVRIDKCGPPIANLRSVTAAAAVAAGSPMRKVSVVNDEDEEEDEDVDVKDEDEAVAADPVNEGPSVAVETEQTSS